MHDWHTMHTVIHTVASVAMWSKMLGGGRQWEGSAQVRILTFVLSDRFVMDPFFFQSGYKTMSKVGLELFDAVKS